MAIQFGGGVKKKLPTCFSFFFHTRVALPAQRACHGRPNTGLAASPATSNDAIRVREMCWGEPNQASLLFSYFSQCCCARQPHSSEGMLCFCQGASRNTDLFAMAGKTASRLLAFCDSRISCGSLLTPSHSTSKSVRWQWSWGIESMDRASRPSSECSSFGQIQSIQCATKRFKICQSGLVLSDSIVFFIFQVTDGAPQKRPRN